MTQLKLVLLALGCATPALVLTFTGQIPAAFSWLALEMLVLWLGWKLRWSVVTRELAAQALGSKEDLALAVAFPSLGPTTAMAISLGETIDLGTLAPEYRLPTIDIGTVLARLPAIPPRNWRPTGATELPGEGADYVAATRLDLAAELKRLDTVYRRNNRPQA